MAFDFSSIILLRIPIKKLINRYLHSLFGVIICNSVHMRISRYDSGLNHSLLAAGASACLACTPGTYMNSSGACRTTWCNE